jgi:hypothetical protein
MRNSEVGSQESGVAEWAPGDEVRVGHNSISSGLNGAKIRRI